MKIPMGISVPLIPTPLFVGLKNKDVTRSNKIVTMSLIFGTLLICLGLILFLPGSSSVLDQLFQI